MANLVFLAGRKGSGKTTLLKALVLENLRAFPDVRFVVWDRTQEWVRHDRLLVLPANQVSGEEAAYRALELAPCTLVVDEIDLIAPNKSQGLRPGSALHAIVHYGRHEQVAMLCAARRSTNVHTDVRALADVIFFFRHREPRDVAWIGELAGPEWAESVQRLGHGEWLRCDL